jgi:CheY-like chemotaxis protein/HPt (histidine-containing phosphotransfer) domain-containing protein
MKYFPSTANNKSKTLLHFLFQAYLKDVECTIEFAENGHIAVQKFFETDFVLILMDIQMPTLDGNSATKIIRSHERNNKLSPVPIIALTAYALEEEKERSMNAGCNMHVIKPVSKHTLLAAIRRVIPEKKVSPLPEIKASQALIAVRIDKMLEDLIPGFLENRRHDIIAIRDAVSQGNLENVERLGHMIKGSGGGYGFENISEIGKKLESAAKKKEVNKILAIVKELEDYLNEVQIIFVE